MRIAAVQRTSFVDYPGKIAAVVFTPGCNLRCVFCHNRGLIDSVIPERPDSGKEFFAWLETRRGLLDAVVISGGEPTLQPNLGGFIERIRALGYTTKLDTNGTNPIVLASLIRSGLLDYAAMDVKATPHKYPAVCGVPVDMNSIERSMDVLMQGLVEYEFRTTCVPELTPDDILAIGQRLRGARRYVLQQYRELQLDTVPGRPRWVSMGYPAWLDGVRKRLGEMVGECSIRGFEDGPIPSTRVR